MNCKQLFFIIFAFIFTNFSHANASMQYENAFKKLDKLKKKYRESLPKTAEP